MPLVQQGGLTGKKAGLQGIEKAADSFMAGYLGRKQQARDDAQIIWKMAQDDPLILEDVKNKRIFKIAGYAEPNAEPIKRRIEQENEYRRAQIEAMKTRGKNSWAAINQLLDIRKNADDANNQEVVDTVDKALAQIMPQTPPAPAPPPEQPGWWSRVWGAKPTNAAQREAGLPTTDTLPRIGSITDYSGETLMPQFFPTAAPAPAALPKYRTAGNWGGGYVRPAALGMGGPTRVPMQRPAARAGKPAPTGVGIGKPGIRPQPAAPRPEFNAIWPSLSVEQKYKVAKAMANGFQPAEILASLQSEIGGVQ